MRLILLGWAMLLPVMPAARHHYPHPVPVPARVMCPFAQQQCQPGPILGK